MNTTDEDGNDSGNARYVQFILPGLEELRSGEWRVQPDEDDDNSEERQRAYHAPEWIADKIAQYQELFDLQRWTIFVFVTNFPSEEQHGVCHIWPRVRKAIILFRATMEPGRDATATILHEMLHVVFADNVGIVEDCIIPELPEPAQGLAMRAYRATLEPLVDHLAQLFESAFNLLDEYVEK